MLKTQACEALVIDLSMSGDPSGSAVLATSVIVYLKYIGVLTVLERRSNVWHSLREHFSPSVQAMINRDCASKAA
jgi:hypothetical protein